MIKMAVIQYDKDNNILTYHDLQDKSRWCKEGESQEQSFVRRFSELGYDINPEKSKNPYAPDLIKKSTGLLADLKGQHSPFFKAEVLYGIEPTYAVVFNVKDKERYEQLYPNIEIVYYVDWVSVRALIWDKEYKVTPHCGVYRTTFSDLLELLKKSSIHSYQQRINDNKGNARDSYVLDIRNPIFQRLF